MLRSAILTRCRFARQPIPSKVNPLLTAPDHQTSKARFTGWRLTPWRVFLASLCVLIGTGGFLYPGFVVTHAFFDPALNGAGVPKLARQLHESLSPRYARWTTERLTSGKAAHLEVSDVSGTEWPLYGSAFYLRAEEALQNAWEQDHSLFNQEPRVYAKDAIQAATRLVADPQHATWVRQYWGDSYLQKEDVFYRMLLISSLASHRHLTGSDEFLPLLRSQVEGLATELDTSPTGWLDDYPGQCFPTDIISAWEAIHRADTVLGTDHSPQIARALQAFTGDRAGRYGLPPYAVRATTGQRLDDSRGCSNSNACMLAPSLWPETAHTWYTNYEKTFWQQDWLAAGFREFPRGRVGGEWYFDVDAGPVVRGNGFAACAFGVAAARSNGRFDHAYPLSLEMIALSWSLPGGRLVLPRLASDSQSAPFLGEVAVLFQLTQQPVGSQTLRHHAGSVPMIVLFCLAFYLGGGLILVWGAIKIVRPHRRSGQKTGMSSSPPLISS